MSDQLYLSLWFPNFRLEALPAALISVLQQFARISGDSRVSAASAIPIDWTESPIYQRIYVNDERSEESDDAKIEMPSVRLRNNSTTTPPTSSR